MICNIKLLNGDLVQVENIDPRQGFFGVAKMLSQFEPETFPFGFTTLRYADEENPKFDNLVAIVVPFIESIQSVEEYGGEENEKCYRFTIKIDRQRSTSVFKNFENLTLFQAVLGLHQLFDIFYFPNDNKFHMPRFGYSDPTMYRVFSPASFPSRCTNVYDALNKLVHYIKEDGYCIIEEVQFSLNEFAVCRIGSMITKWIDDQRIREKT
jgi:hypothetical protein